MGIFNKHRHLRPEILSEYLDGRLDHRHQGLVAHRLAECAACREELNTLRATVAALQNLPDLPLPRSFTLPTAPTPDYPAELIRKPAPPASLVMKLPGWAYGSAASLAGLALALMLSAEAAGLTSPAFLVSTAPATAPATAAPGDAGVAKEAQDEAGVAAKAEPLVAAPERAAQAEAPTDFQSAEAPQTAQRSAAAPTAEAAAKIGESALAENSLAEPASPAPEAALAAPEPQTAMAESQGAVAASDPASEEAVADAVAASDPASEEAAADAAAATASDPAGEEGVADVLSDPPGEDVTAFSLTQSDDRATAPEDSLPSVQAKGTPVAPADSAQSPATEPKAPVENLGIPAQEYSAPSSITWWKALETMFAALTLAFLGGLFYRWRRNRSQSDA